MTCTALPTELSQLREQRRGQVQLIATLPDNAGKQAAEEQLARIDADIASTQAELTLCLAQEAQAQNPVPQTSSVRSNRSCVIRRLVRSVTTSRTF